MSMNRIDGPAFAGDVDEGEWQNQSYWRTVATACDVLLQDGIASERFGFDSVVVPLSDGLPVPSVDQPLVPSGQGGQSPLKSPSTTGPVFDQYPCQEAGSSTSGSCNFDILDGHTGTSEIQEFLGPYFTDGSDDVLNIPHGNPVATEEADVYALRCIIPAPGAPAAAVYFPWGDFLTAPALSESAWAESQRKHCCELWVTNAKFPFGQTLCGKTFAKYKDLKRHQLSVHREDDDPVYTCRCGRDNPRKDNHIRHIDTCANKPSLRSYVCKCSESIKEQHDYLNQVKACRESQGSRGRASAS